MCPFVCQQKEYTPTGKEITMDISTLYNIYSDAVDWGKLTVLKAFWDALKGNPILAIFFTCLLVKDIKKTVTAFIKYFV